MPRKPAARGGSLGDLLLRNVRRGDAGPGGAQTRLSHGAIGKTGGAPDADGNENPAKLLEKLIAGDWPRVCMRLCDQGVRVLPLKKGVARVWWLGE